MFFTSSEAICFITRITILLNLVQNCSGCPNEMCFDTCVACYERNRSYQGMFGPCENMIDENINYWPGKPKSMAISVKYEGEEMLPFYYITVGVPSIESMDRFEGIQLNIIKIRTSDILCLTTNFSSCSITTNHRFTFCIGLTKDVYAFHSQLLPPPPSKYKAANSITLTTQAIQNQNVHHKTVGFITYRIFSGNEPGASLNIIFEPINWIHYDISLRLDTHEPIYVRDQTLILSGDKNGKITFSSLCNGRYFIEIQAIPTSENNCPCSYLGDCVHCPRVTMDVPVEIFINGVCVCTDFKCHSESVTPVFDGGSEKVIPIGIFVVIVISLVLLLLLSIALIVLTLLFHHLNNVILKNNDWNDNISDSISGMIEVSTAHESGESQNNTENIIPLQQSREDLGEASCVLRTQSTECL